MARLALNKSSLNREQRMLRTFERFLPSLDLKRRQLMAEHARAARELGAVRKEIEERTRAIGRDLPMLANTDIALDRLVSIEAVELGEENIVGTRLPVLRSLSIHTSRYPLMAKPHWVDGVVEELRTVLELRARERVAVKRLELLGAAVRVITQRVNLFDKVLIPRARRNIKRIRIYLSDSERAGVVTSKIAKGKRARELDAA